MKNVVSKNKALEVTKLKERELNVIIGKFPDQAATYDYNRQMDKIKLEGIVEILKNEGIRLELGLVDTQELQSIAVESGLFTVDSQYPNRLSDFINKAARDGKISFVNTTIAHGEDKKRKLSHRLFRLEECKEYVKESFALKKSKKETAVKAAEIVRKHPEQNEINLSEQISQMTKITNFVNERVNKLELMVESLQTENSKKNKLIEELQTANELLVGELSSVQQYVGKHVAINKDMPPLTIISINEQEKLLLDAVYKSSNILGLSEKQVSTIKSAHRKVFVEGFSTIGKAAHGILTDFKSHVSL